MGPHSSWLVAHILEVVHKEMNEFSGNVTVWLVAAASPHAPVVVVNFKSRQPTPPMATTRSATIGSLGLYDAEAERRLRMHMMHREENGV